MTVTLAIYGAKHWLYLFDKHANDNVDSISLPCAVLEDGRNKMIDKDTGIGNEKGPNVILSSNTKRPIRQISIDSNSRGKKRAKFRGL
jgi:hypothetical protein